MFLLMGQHGACQETWAGCFSYQMQGLGSVGGWGEVDPTTAWTGRAQPGACSWPWLEAGGWAGLPGVKSTLHWREGQGRAVCAGQGMMSRDGQSWALALTPVHERTG